ncbi:hypothetical protein AB1046_01260 [Promicromonospora sp. Populi]|uniref:hypothetical protein n=1 Tax=Promicromonospora sp. Populi TaxID=3239420 RepID=UPI0034E2F0DE
MRALILPATPLLVPGLTPGLRPDPLGTVRRAVATALAGLIADGHLPLVLAHGPALRWGRLRPSLAGSGISDRWLPGLRAWHDLPAAGTGASVALLALADVLGERVADVETLEVPPDWDWVDGALPDDAPPSGGGPAELLRDARGLVVAGGGAPGSPDAAPDALTDGIRAALRVAGADAWGVQAQVFEQSHGHLPAQYRVTTLL